MTDRHCLAAWLLGAPLACLLAGTAGYLAAMGDVAGAWCGLASGGLVLAACVWAEVCS